jgi:Ca2+-binding EF-hand superfamily protein
MSVCNGTNLNSNHSNNPDYPITTIEKNDKPPAVFKLLMSRPVCDCLTDDQLKSFKRAFDHRDKDQDGHVNRDEFKAALKLVGIIPTDDEFRAMLEDIGKESIDLLDFVSVIYYFLRGADSREELIRAFAVFDKAGDGKIPVETAVQILTNLKHPVPREQVDELMQKLDHGNSGKVDYAAMIRELRPE